MIGRPYKIAVAGTHSTGKTTFLSRLRAEFATRGIQAGYVHESAAVARDLGFPILAEHDFDSTAWLIARTIEAESVAALGSDVILVDRPVLDALGYLLAALRHTERKLQPGRFERLEALCAAWSAEYDLLFLTEVDPSIDLGQGRDGDGAFRIAAADALAEVVGRLYPGALLLDSAGTDTALSLALGRVEAFRGQGRGLR